MEYKIVEKSVLARIAGIVLKSNAAAITLGKNIHISGVKKEVFLKDKRWLEHELEHVRQFREIGYFRFIILYMLECLKNGYYNNRFEVEARQAEKKVD